MNVILTSSIVNPGFENANMDGFSIGDGTWALQTNAFSAHSGQRYVRATATPGNWATMYLDTGMKSCAPGDKLNFSAYARRVQGNAMGRLILCLFKAGGADPIYVPSANVSSGTWAPQSIAEYTVPADYVFYRFALQIHNDGTISNTLIEWDTLTATRTGPISGADVAEATCACGTKTLKFTA